MGFLKKCDICGKAYEPYCVTKKDIGPNGISFVNVPNCSSTSAYMLDVIDCCPEHMERIKNFIDDLIEEGNDPVKPDKPIEPETPEEGEDTDGSGNEDEGDSV